MSWTTCDNGCSLIPSMTLPFSEDNCYFLDLLTIILINISIIVNRCACRHNYCIDCIIIIMIGAIADGSSIDTAPAPFKHSDNNNFTVNRGVKSFEI